VARGGFTSFSGYWEWPRRAWRPTVWRHWRPPPGLPAPAVLKGIRLFFQVKSCRGGYAGGWSHGQKETAGAAARTRDLVSLLRNLGRAQADDAGRPLFNGKYVTYPQFKKERWAYWRTYHAHIREELICRALKVKCLGPNLKALVGDVEELDELWDMLDICYDQPEQYIAEFLEPIIRFRKYKVFEHTAIGEFYSLLRSVMMGARGVNLLRKLINEQTLPGIMSRMPPD
jgi:hypothetical protein